MTINDLLVPRSFYVREPLVEEWNDYVLDLRRWSLKTVPQPKHKNHEMSKISISDLSVLGSVTNTTTQSTLIAS